MSNEMTDVNSVNLESGMTPEQRRAAMERMEQLLPPKYRHFTGRLVAGLNAEADHSDHHTWFGIEGGWPMPKLGLEELQDSDIYRSCLSEFMSTFIFTLVHIAIISAVFVGGVGAEAPVIYVALLHGILFVLLIFSYGSTSGAHMNPLFSFATLCTCHITVTRAVMYMATQLISSTICAAILRDIFGQKIIYGTCERGELTGTQAWFLETAFTLCLLGIVYGIVLHKTQSALYGPLLGPLCIGFVAFLVFTVAIGLGGIVGWGIGAGPNFCLAGLVGTEDNANAKRDIWIVFAGGATASIINAIMYFACPPHEPPPPPTKDEKIE